MFHTSVTVSAACIDLGIGGCRLGYSCTVQVAICTTNLITLLIQEQEGGFTSAASTTSLCIIDYLNYATYGGVQQNVMMSVEAPGHTFMLTIAKVTSLTGLCQLASQAPNQSTMEAVALSEAVQFGVVVEAWVIVYCTLNNAKRMCLTSTQFVSLAPTVHPLVMYHSFSKAWCTTQNWSSMASYKPDIARLNVLNS